MKRTDFIAFLKIAANKFGDDIINEERRAEFYFGAEKVRALKAIAAMRKELQAKFTEIHMLERNEALYPST